MDDNELKRCIDTGIDKYSIECDQGISMLMGAEYYTKTEILTILDWMHDGANHGRALKDRRLINSNDKRIIEDTTREALKQVREEYAIEAFNLLAKKRNTTLDPAQAPSCRAGCA